MNGEMVLNPQPMPVGDFEALGQGCRDRVKEICDKIIRMVGFLPNEAELVIAQVIHARTHVDRDANLELGLFTNVAPGETITEATLTEPTGGGYARISLVDGTWTFAGDPAKASYAQQTFSPSGAAFTGSVQGYFIATNSAGGTKRIYMIEVDSNGPYTLNDGDEYKVTPGNTVDNP